MPDRLREAADVIADGARVLAGTWSRQIPPSIRVESDGKVATVSSRVGPARPAEYQLRHPLFGNRRHWYGPPGPPFLGPAADARIDAAMEKYAEKIRDVLILAGFK